jgi:dCTP deaminase
MSFLNTDQMQEEINNGSLVINPIKPERLKNGAYELSVGAEFYHTALEDGKTTASQGTQITIPPGQLGILITEEILTIPKNKIGFISIKFREKIQGLINVSGFHVDPGFHGRLKFSVYNAGSRKAVFNPGQELFTLWLSKYGEPGEPGQPDEKPYNGLHQNQMEIKGEDVENVQGVIASPGSLLKQFEDLKTEQDRRIVQIENQQDKRIASMENQWSWLKWIVGITTTLWVATFLRPQLVYWQSETGSVSPEAQQPLGNEVQPESRTKEQATAPQERK